MPRAGSTGQCVYSREGVNRAGTAGTEGLRRWWQVSKVQVRRCTGGVLGWVMSAEGLMRQGVKASDWPRGEVKKARRRGRPSGSDCRNSSGRV